MVALHKKQKGKMPLPRSISWQAPEFEFTEKGMGWNAVVIGLTLLFFIWRALAADFTGSLLALLAGFTFLVYSHKRPRTVTFELRPTGIKIGDRMHHYSDLHSFWIFYHPPHVKEVSIRSNRLTEPRFHLPLINQNPVIIRRYLSQYLPEEEQHYSTIDGFMRAIGF